MVIMTEMPVAVVSGATRGIGKEVARGLAARGCRVWLGCRDLSAGEAVAAELGASGAVTAVELDIADDDSVVAAAGVIERDGRVDILINNAATGGSRPAVEDTVAGDFSEVMNINLLGAVRLTHALLPLMHKSASPRIVNVTSGRGSFTVNNDPERMESQLQGLVYPVSKAALNMLTYQYARALPTFRVNAVDPGYTATSLNNFTGTRSPAESAQTIIALALDAEGGATGQLFDASGVLGW
ncbi:SDR family NAD(P)-dependent oxidoreductase [Nocardia arthritidis]|uniref:SDR family NAD(P)-dependent oxidoreductase n=1 Tax=Nocardia arthritidis TaxID=228602 RepID=A0A6G9YBJ2_9NOCA|nr:SDR family NAD(P)-dependent oxidoreductase [Nocardia arthritidis]QIS10599.1 SDR family NAD(P)-dependent oxidoreductase [Nocardia arthritidis]